MYKLWLIVLSDNRLSCSERGPIIINGNFDNGKDTIDANLLANQKHESSLPREILTLRIRSESIYGIGNSGEK